MDDRKFEMELANSSTRDVTIDFTSVKGGPREDFSVEDEYIYDDYDSEPLLSSQADLELSRHYQGRKYLFLRQDEADASTIIPFRWRFRRFALKGFIGLLLCGFGGLLGYFVTVKYVHSCIGETHFATNDLLNFPHEDYVIQISSKDIGEFLRYVF